MPAACPSLQMNPETDWMYTADAGNCGLGLTGGRMMVPRGKMLGGSSGINYMAYVRGHPGDFDSWAADGATGWSYEEVLPYFKKSEGLAPSGDIVVDTEAHNTQGQLGVSFGLLSWRVPGSSSRPRSPPGSVGVTTTDATGAVPTASCRCFRPRRAMANGRARTMRSLRARRSTDRTSS